MIFEDGFGREEIGDDWTEVSGDWEIDGEQLVVESSGAVVVADENNEAEPPGGGGFPPYIVTAVLVMRDPDTDPNTPKYRIIVDYTDSSNYVFFEAEYFHWDDPPLRNDWVASYYLYRKAGGVDTLLCAKKHQRVGHLANVPFQLITVYVQEDTIVVHFNADLVNYTIGAETTPTSTSWGLGAGNAEPTVFGSAQLEYGDSEDHPECASETHGCQVFLEETWPGEDEPGQEWDEVEGNWYIEDDEVGIKVTGTSEAILVTDREFEPPYYILAGGTIGSGEEPRIIFCYEDADNYWFVEFYWDAVLEETTIKLYERSGGSDTLRGSELFGEVNEPVGITAAICVLPGVVQVMDPHVGATFHLTYDPGPDLPTGSVGMGTSNTLEHVFGSFGVYTHSLDDPNCFHCANCGLCAEAPPVCFKIEISGVANGTYQNCPCCEEMDGTYYLHYHADTSVGKCYYRCYDFPWNHCPVGGADNNDGGYLQLELGSYDWGSYVRNELTVNNAGGTGYGIARFDIDKVDGEMPCDWDEEEPDYLYGTTGKTCDYSGATIKATALFTPCESNPPEEDVGCWVCECGTVAPEEWSVTISGVTANHPSNEAFCAQFNDTHVLSKDANCRWSIELDGATLYLSLYEQFGGPLGVAVSVNVYIEDPGSMPPFGFCGGWEEGEVDCEGVTALTNMGSSCAACDWSGASISITAL